MPEFDQSAVLERVRDFGEALPEHHRLLIIPHDYPDPDALAAAAGLHLLLNQHFHRPSQIAFSGDVSRAENKEFLRRMKFRWHRLSDLRAPAKHVGCIYVDTAPWSRNVTVPAHSRPLAVFDHHQHKAPARWRIPFLNIRPGAGATTTLVYEFLKAAEVDIPRWLAALMAYALASETLDLSREAGDSEHQAYAELAARADLKILGRIRHARLPRSYFAHLQEALTAARRWEDIAWTHLRSTSQPEILAEVADLLLRMEGMRWSFCTATMDGRLFISMRSRHRAARCSRILRAAVGDRGSAGGHHAMAAGFVELDARATSADAEQARADLEYGIIRRLPCGRRLEVDAPRLPGDLLVPGA
jgi:nanoRNase/pAp phosphatase (c-di-AMP/oligoRNAs hydrolase)